MTAALVVLAVGALGLAVWGLLRARNMQLWIGGYLRAVARRSPRPARGAVRHVYFCFADHYEPFWGKVDAARAHARVRRWVEGYPEVAERHRDSDGRAPRHTFFYPEEEYDPQILEWLGGLCRAGYGEVEVHLHHDQDTAANLRRTLMEYKERLFEKHGLLRREAGTGEIAYCFIHGNWALDNSRPDGRWCGVDDEITVLLETGCRCDMTMPSAPSDTQTRKINSIYFAAGRPGRRKSHDDGRDARVGEWRRPGELLLVQGPLTLNWRARKFGIMPRIENGEISADAPPTRDRVRRWVDCGVTVGGAEEHVFVKVHTHGADERTTDMLLGGGFESIWSDLGTLYRDRPGYALHFVSAWEMYARIEALCRTPVGARGGRST
jgi:hypothetical protein